MKYNVYDSNHQLIGKIEENSFYNANGQKEYDIIDGYFCDPITKRVDYRIHDDGTITKGTSNQITAYMHQDGTITKSRNSGIISHVTNNDNFSMSSYSSQSNGELFAIILAIIFLILSAVFIWPAAMQNDGGNILIFGVMLVSILYLIKLI
ncbi:MAG: hypothetical protein ACI33I_07110, partial [Clostridium sp.]